MRSALLSLALALPLPLYATFAAGPAQEARRGTGQDPAPSEPKGEVEEPEEGGGVDIFGRPRGTKSKLGARGLLQGCWKLTDAELDGLLDGGRKAAGALLVDDEFLAFELHMAWPGGSRGPTVHQSFIAEYDLSDGRKLTVTTVIGSFLDQRLGILDWEKTGFAREYQVSVTGDRLVLSFGQASKLSFVRQRGSGPGGRDIFGRERRDASGERDIFGRPRASRDGDAPEKGKEGAAPEPGRGGETPR